MQVLDKAQIFTVPLKKMGNMSVAGTRILPAQILFNFLLAMESVCFSSNVKVHAPASWHKQRK